MSHLGDRMGKPQLARSRLRRNRRVLPPRGKRTWQPRLRATVLYLRPHNGLRPNPLAAVSAHAGDDHSASCVRVTLLFPVAAASLCDALWRRGGS